MNPTPPDATPAAEKCDTCGAPRVAADGSGASASSSPSEAVPPATHCEWCGAEYEAPAEDA